MITVKARINITGTSKGNITGVDISPNGNNVSANGSALINKKGTSLGNPFILGRSILGTNAKYTKQLPYYMGSELANAGGNFKSTYTIQVSGSNLAAVVIVFDKENSRHPNTVTVDGKIFTDDDPQFEIPLTGSSASHTIQISNWNTPNEPLVITGIYADVNIEINNTNLVSFRSNIMDRETSDYPSYGIISNSANLNFADFDQQTLDLITQKVLHSGITVTAWLENEEENAKEQICEMEIRDLTYDNNNRQVQLTLKDNLEDWQDINVPSIDYDPRNPQSQTAEWYYKKLYDITVGLKKYNILSFDELDRDTKEILSSVTIQYPLLESGNLWDSWDKLCQLCLLHMYIDSNNRVVVKYSI